MPGQQTKVKSFAGSQRTIEHPSEYGGARPTLASF
jgi:hypothetical protein